MSMETSQALNGNPVSGLDANMNHDLHIEISKMCNELGFQINVFGDETAEHSLWTIFNYEVGFVCKEVSRMRCYFILKGYAIAMHHLNYKKSNEEESII